MYRFESSVRACALSLFSLDKKISSALSLSIATMFINGHRYTQLDKPSEMPWSKSARV